ncbi:MULTISPECIES: NuoM family protein [unclassified Spirosoma]|uniref:complex I subunit 4 family protein n=1 Tax=unclassified Spirosoma TaxID=2621999 RepID=UPI000960BC18|nr:MULTISPECIES: NADH-quinone oxidoreductase subunit M [unclassified Spirosoma]MBN8824618.1 NADH-quinone oxidoreductase subunit M [Spirosoma sp.]OJW78827.1 MAG: oxidoreductase [Spirosoma sp. 48-14]
MILSLLIFLPLLGALVIALLPESQVIQFRWIAFVITLAEVMLSVVAYREFNQAIDDYQLVEQVNWITLPLGNLGIVSIDYLLGIDGISLPLVILSAVVMLIGVGASWTMTHRLRAYYSLYLLLTGTVMGCFVALDFFLFFLFFEFMLLPMYFLIGLWGGPRREYASIKFFLYTLFGSLLILLVMIGLSLSVMDPVSTAITAGLIPDPSAVTDELMRSIQSALQSGQLNSAQIVHTFTMRYLSDSNNYLPNALLNPASQLIVWGFSARQLAFWAIFIGFAIKLPIVPLHTWLPEAHVEAPTPVSVVLAGVLLKIGGYGFLRIAWDFFPDGAVNYTQILAGLGVLSIVYGGLNALAQADLKKMIAYSSVSHMGFVLLGIASLTAEGINGAIYQMVSHGVLSAMLFLIAGVVYDRTHDRRIDSYRGLMKPMPRYTTLTAIAFFASLGLPGFSGFVGELFTLMGSFQSRWLAGWLTVVATTGVLLAAAYFLWTLQRMFFGPYWSRHEATTVLTDLTAREKLMLIPLAVLALLLGLFPNLIFNLTNATVTQWLLKFSVE